MLICSLQFLVKMLKGVNEMDRRVDIIQDVDGNKIVIIQDAVFKGKKKVDWKNVKAYLKQYVGQCCEIEETAEIIYIGNRLPDEYTGSNSRINLQHRLAKAKANVTQGIPELINSATNPIWEENKKEKHNKDAKYGGYRYDVQFGIPVYEKEKIVRYNIFSARLLVNHAENGNKYLYDLIEIKKKDESPTS